MSIQLLKRKTEILAKHRAKFPEGDWRQTDYAPELWTAVQLKANFSAGKQHADLQKGEIILYKLEARALNSTRCIILHDRLMCPTSLGDNYARYIGLIKPE